MALIIGSADYRRRIHWHKQRALISRIPHGYTAMSTPPVARILGSDRKWPDDESCLGIAPLKRVFRGRRGRRSERSERGHGPQRGERSEPP